jgi:hypothetical protein
MSLVAEMIPMTRNGCGWKPPPSSRATGEHHDGDHHQGDRDGHEHNALGAHQDPEHSPGGSFPAWRVAGQALVIERARLWSAHDRLPSVPCPRPGYGETRRWLSTVATPGAEAAATRAALASCSECTCP